jgi:N-acetyl-gamma-glutamyl-phosphate reductase
MAGVLSDVAPLIVDAKSGITGAGRTPQLQFHFPEMFGNFAPYKPGRVHRHVGEI